MGGGWWVLLQIHCVGGWEAAAVALVTQVVRLVGSTVLVALVGRWVLPTGKEALVLVHWWVSACCTGSHLSPTAFLAAAVCLARWRF